MKCDDIKILQFFSPCLREAEYLSMGELQQKGLPCGSPDLSGGVFFLLFFPCQSF